LKGAPRAEFGRKCFREFIESLTVGKNLEFVRSKIRGRGNKRGEGWMVNIAWSEWGRTCKGLRLGMSVWKVSLSTCLLSVLEGLPQLS
jgi:hypothetical protein